jgi:hypothetical protein
MERPHGFALIINIKSYQGITDEGVVLEERKGSDVDVQNLMGLWIKLGFSVEIHLDLKAHQICKVVDDMSRKIERLHNSSCFVCCIMSHGAMGKIYGSNSNYVDIKYITDLFKEDKCPALAGKPKLFFIQACRGNQLLTGCSTSTATPVPISSTNAVIPGTSPATTSVTPVSSSTIAATSMISSTNATISVTSLTNVAILGTSSTGTSVIPGTSSTNTVIQGNNSTTGTAIIPRPSSLIAATSTITSTNAEIPGTSSTNATIPSNASILGMSTVIVAIPGTTSTDTAAPGTVEFSPTRLISELDADAGGIDYDHLNEAAFRDSVDPSEPHFLLGYSTVPGKTNCTSLLSFAWEHASWGAGTSQELRAVGEIII